MQLEKILSDIKDERTLWSKELPKLNAREEAQAYARVGSKNSLTGSEVKAIFKVLRTKYEQEVKREKSNWKLLTHMSFLSEKSEKHEEKDHEDEMYFELLEVKDEGDLSEEEDIPYPIEAKQIKATEYKNVSSNTKEVSVQSTFSHNPCIPKKMNSIQVNAACKLPDSETSRPARNSTAIVTENNLKRKISNGHTEIQTTKRMNISSTVPNKPIITTLPSNHNSSPTPIVSTQSDQSQTNGTVSVPKFSGDIDIKIKPENVNPQNETETLNRNIEQEPTSSQSLPPPIATTSADSDDNNFPPHFINNLCNSKRFEALGLYVANVMNRLPPDLSAKLEINILKNIIEVESEQLNN